MYRAVTWCAMQRGIPLSDEEALSALARTMTFELDPRNGGTLLVNGLPPNPELRGPAVDAAVSEVSAHPEVRAELVRRQQELANAHCVVMVGRDIGTTVLPCAPLKLWITASPEVRASRRSEENGVREDALERIETRDAIDSGRVSSPLRRAADAIVVQTDRLTPAQAQAQALDAVHQEVARQGSSTRSG